MPIRDRAWRLAGTTLLRLVAIVLISGTGTAHAVELVPTAASRSVFWIQDYRLYFTGLAGCWLVPYFPGLDQVCTPPDLQQSTTSFGGFEASLPDGDPQIDEIVQSSDIRVDGVDMSGRIDVSPYVIFGPLESLGYVYAHGALTAGSQLRQDFSLPQTGQATLSASFAVDDQQGSRAASVVARLLDSTGSPLAELRPTSCTVVDPFFGFFVCAPTPQQVVLVLPAGDYTLECDVSATKWAEDYWCDPVTEECGPSWDEHAIVDYDVSLDVAAGPAAAVPATDAAGMVLLVLGLLVVATARRRAREGRSA